MGHSETPLYRKDTTMSKHHAQPRTTIGDAIIAVVTVPLLIVWSLTGN